MRLGETDLALAHFRQAVAINPALLPRTANLGQLLLDLGRPDQRCRTARKLFRSSRTCPKATTTWATPISPWGSRPTPEHASPKRLAATRILPRLIQLRLALQQEGHWEEALPWLRRATELNPNSLVFLAILAEAAVDRERFDEALGCYEKMLGLDPALRPRTTPWDGFSRRRAGLPRRLSTCAGRSSFVPRLQSRMSTWAGFTKSSAISPRPRRAFEQPCPIRRRAAPASLGWPCCCAARCRRPIARPSSGAGVRPSGRPLARQPDVRASVRLGCARALCRSRRLRSRGQRDFARPSRSPRARI